jgi:hypothetical protein
MKFIAIILIGFQIMQPYTGSFNYVGNPDFRGYLSYLTQNGDDATKNEAQAVMTYTGNDGIVDPSLKANGDYDKWQGTASNYFNQWHSLAYPSAAASSSGDPNTAAYYDDTAKQLQGQLGQLDPQQQIGLDNLQNSYNLGRNRLTESQAAGQRNYNTSRDQNIQGYANTRGTIINNTSATNSALQRLLGINGAGNSSAAYEAAPWAAALQGSQNLQGAQTTYANNQSALDTNWQDAQRGYTNAFDDLDRQKYQQENSLRSSIAQTRASLLDKIASAGVNANLARGAMYSAAVGARTPYQQQINDLLSQITQLGRQYANPVVQEQNVSYAAPDLGQYAVNRQAAPTGGAQGSVDPAFLGLLSQQRDRYGNILQ